jgi:hypothetical protein
VVTLVIVNLLSLKSGECYYDIRGKTDFNFPKTEGKILAENFEMKNDEKCLEVEHPSVTDSVTITKEGDVFIVKYNDVIACTYIHILPF